MGDQLLAAIDAVGRLLPATPRVALFLASRTRELSVDDHAVGQGQRGRQEPTDQDQRNDRGAHQSGVSNTVTAVTLP